MNKNLLKERLSQIVLRKAEEASAQIKESRAKMFSEASVNPVADLNEQSQVVPSSAPSEENAQAEQSVSVSQEDSGSLSGGGGTPLSNPLKDSFDFDLSQGSRTPNNEGVETEVESSQANTPDIFRSGRRLSNHSQNDEVGDHSNIIEALRMNLSTPDPSLATPISLIPREESDATNVVDPWESNEGLVPKIETSSSALEGGASGNDGTKTLDNLDLFNEAISKKLKEVEDLRNVFAEKDSATSASWKKILRIIPGFKEGGNATKEVSEAKTAYTRSLTELRALQLDKLRSQNLSEEELKKEMASLLKMSAFDEMESLWEAKFLLKDRKDENFIKRAFGKFEQFSEKYRTLDWKIKLGLGIALGGATVASVASGMSGAVAFIVAIRAGLGFTSGYATADALTKVLDDVNRREAIQYKIEAFSAEMKKSSEEEKFLKLSKFLEKDIAKIEEQLEQRKRAEKWRTGKKLLAGGAFAGLAIYFGAQSVESAMANGTGGGAIPTDAPDQAPRPSAGALDQAVDSPKPSGAGAEVVAPGDSATAVTAEAPDPVVTVPEKAVSLTVEKGGSLEGTIIEHLSKKYPDMSQEELGRIAHRTVLDQAEKLNVDPSTFGSIKAGADFSLTVNNADGELIVSFEGLEKDEFIPISAQGIHGGDVPTTDDARPDDYVQSGGNKGENLAGGGGAKGVNLQEISAQITEAKNLGNIEQYINAQKMLSPDTGAKIAKAVENAEQWLFGKESSLNMQTIDSLPGGDRISVAKILEAYLSADPTGEAPFVEASASLDHKLSGDQLKNLVGFIAEDREFIGRPQFSSDVSIGEYLRSATIRILDAGGSLPQKVDDSKILELAKMIAGK